MYALMFLFVMMKGYGACGDDNERERMPIDDQLMRSSPIAASCDDSNEVDGIFERFCRKKNRSLTQIEDLTHKERSCLYEYLKGPFGYYAQYSSQCSDLLCLLDKKMELIMTWIQNDVAGSDDVEIGFAEGEGIMIQVVKSISQLTFSLTIDEDDMIFQLFERAQESHAVFAKALCLVLCARHGRANYCAVPEESMTLLNSAVYTLDQVRCAFKK